MVLTSCDSLGAIRDREEELLKKRTLVLQSKMRECTSRVASLFDAIGGRDMPAVSAGALAGADESDDSASVPGSTPRSARGDAARPKSRSATRRVIAAKKAKEGGLDAVISRDRRRSRREKRGSVAGSVAGSMAEVERLSKMDVNNVNVLRFLGLIEQRAMDITTSFAQQHMPEGVKFSDVPIDGPPVPFARDKRKFHIAVSAARHCLSDSCLTRSCPRGTLSRYSSSRQLKTMIRAYLTCLPVMPIPRRATRRVGAPLRLAALRSRAAVTAVLPEWRSRWMLKLCIPRSR